MQRRAAVLAIVLVCLGPVSLAQAQLGPNVPAPLTEDPPPPPPPPPNEFDDGGISTLQKVLIFGAAALVLATIAVVIVRDARRRRAGRSQGRHRVGEVGARARAPAARQAR